MKTLIIPAAGLATRLRPISNNTSKCMVAVNGRPIISYILDTVGTLYDQIVIVHGANTDVVQFCTRQYPGLSLSFVKQHQALGPLHAVWCALESINETTGTVTIWLGDTIVTDYTPGSKSEVVAAAVPDWSRWCLISPDGTSVFDKPASKPSTNLALVGIYTFDDIHKASTLTDKIIGSCQRVNGEFQLSQLITAYDGCAVVQTEQWYDCGDLPSLYSSAARLLAATACRPGSTVQIDTARGTFKKSGDRCIAERAWYAALPDSAKPFVPAVYSSGSDYYEMELLTGSTVHDILLYENLTTDGVGCIVQRCLDSYWLAFNPQDHGKFNSHEMFITKNIARVQSYSGRYSFVSDATISQYCDYCTALAPMLNVIGGEAPLIHGDFHAGNILFSPESGRVRCIDPRGRWGDVITTAGNCYYDFAKFAQSFAGEYIWIYSGAVVNTTVRDTALAVLERWLTQHGYNSKAVLALVPVLLGSILDFHTDSPERQARIWNKTLELLS